MQRHQKTQAMIETVLKLCVLGALSISTQFRLFVFTTLTMVRTILITGSKLETYTHSMMRNIPPHLFKSQENV